MSEHDLNIRTDIDPSYLLYENHVVSGSGLYCPHEEALYDPPKGMKQGDNCPLCNETA